MIFKPLANSDNCNTTPSSYGNNVLVRVSKFNNPNTATVVICKANTGTQKWSILVLGGESVVLEKTATDTLETATSATDMRAVAVSYKY